MTVSRLEQTGENAARRACIGTYGIPYPLRSRRPTVPRIGIAIPLAGGIDGINGHHGIGHEGDMSSQHIEWKWIGGIVGVSDTKGNPHLERPVPIGVVVYGIGAVQTRQSIRNQRRLKIAPSG